jgi:hypothetical protein
LRLAAVHAGAIGPEGGLAMVVRSEARRADRRPRGLEQRRADDAHGLERLSG